MNGKKAKKIRKKVYGEDGSPRFRKYADNTRKGGRMADPQRRIYQQMKKAMRGVRA